MHHVKNMLDENRKLEVEQLAALPIVQENDRVYKPSYTIEFDRTGEVLLYSCEPFKHMTIYFKYPYILYESLIPLSLWCLYMNPRKEPLFFSRSFFISEGSAA